LEALARKHPGAELMLLLGVDSLASMEKWRNPGRIRELATLAALARGGPENSARKAGEGVEVVTTRQVEMSSSEIRARLAAGKPVRGFVAESVERYIAAAKLYGPRADG
jgi:nicotinate-nucleotide adenylyltransferase